MPRERQVIGDLPREPEPLPLPVVDSHCHLDLSAGERDGDRPHLSVDEALERSTRAGVPRIVQIGCDLAGARWAVETARRYDAIVAGVSLHPNEAPRLAARGRLDEALSEIDRLAGDDCVRAVGETGLDYYRTAEEGRRAQHESFRAHIELAKRHDKALVIHDRDAHDDVLRVLHDTGPPERVVFHCFSGDVAMAEHCVENGWWLSFAGTVTFKNAQPLRDALERVPLERLLVETDAPYLTPMPYRGRPNASYLIPLTARAMAAVKGVAVEELAGALARNTSDAFGTW